MKTVKCSRQNLITSCSWNQVSRDLLGKKPIVRQVSVEGINHPVTVGPSWHQKIGLVAVTVRVSRGIQPIDRHPLAKLRAFQQPVDNFLIIF